MVTHDPSKVVTSVRVRYALLMSKQEDIVDDAVEEYPNDAELQLRYFEGAMLVLLALERVDNAQQEQEEEG